VGEFYHGGTENTEGNSKNSNHKSQISILPHRHREHRGKFQKFKSQITNLPQRHREHRGKFQKFKSQISIYHIGTENTEENPKNSNLKSQIYDGDTERQFPM